MKTILVTGGTGFIGVRIVQLLLEKNYRVILVAQHATTIQHPNLIAERIDLTQQDLPSTYRNQIDGVIHLAGKNIFGRWTPTFKKALYDSRILSTQRLIDTFLPWEQKPRVFISASALGYYGNAGENRVTEETQPGTDFLATICTDLESCAKKADAVDIRTVQVRTALVLGKKGLLAPLFLPFKLGLGSWIGKGTAWFPWIHLDDIAAIYVFALEQENLQGAVNAAAPEYVRQKSFMQLFGKALHRWVLFSIPVALMRLRYGELADTFIIA